MACRRLLLHRSLSRAATEAASVRLRLITKPNCCLCDTADFVLRRAALRSPRKVEIEKLDLAAAVSASFFAALGSAHPESPTNWAHDNPAAQANRHLQVEFGDRVPVLFVNERLVWSGRVHEPALARALASP